MNATGDRRRFPDRHGLLRNRRAVVVDDEGIVIERWLGPATRLRWGELAGARWHGQAQLELITMGSSVTLDRGVVGLDALARLVHARSSKGGQQDALPSAEVEDWLGGFRTAVYRPAADLHEGGCAGLAPVLLAGFTGSVLLWWLVLGFGPPLGASGWWWALWLTVISLTGKLMALGCWLAMRRFGLGGSAACRLTAEADGLTVEQAGEEALSFGWDEVTGLVEWSDGCRVHLADGRDVALPVCPRFAPVIDTLRRLARRHEGFDALHLGVTSTALSRAGAPATGSERGLSRPEHHQGSVDA